MIHQEACGFKCVISDNSYHEPQQYRWYISWNNDNGTWRYHWKVVHKKKWKEKQRKKNVVHFSDISTNTVIYWSYPISNSEKYVKE